MKLLRNLPTRLNKNGYLESWGLFWCDSCNQGEFKSKLIL